MAIRKTHNFTGDLSFIKDRTLPYGGYYSVKPAQESNLKTGMKIVIYEQEFVVTEYIVTEKYGATARLAQVNNLPKALRLGPVFIDAVDKLETSESSSGSKQLDADSIIITTVPYLKPSDVSGIITIGWSCPQCGTINSPWMPTCYNDNCFQATETGRNNMNRRLLEIIQEISEDNS